MQTLCTSLQTYNHTSTPSLNFTGRMLFLTANQQCQSTEGKDNAKTPDHLHWLSATSLIRTNYLESTTQDRTTISATLSANNYLPLLFGKGHLHFAITC